VTISGTILLLSTLETEGQKVDIEPHMERILQLDKQAIEEAYVKHIMRLFDIWMTDYSEEPPRAVRGAQNARSAYARAMNAVEKRERELQK